MLMLGSVSRPVYRKLGRLGLRRWHSFLNHHLSGRQLLNLLKHPIVLNFLYPDRRTLEWTAVNFVLFYAPCQIHLSNSLRLILSTLRMLGLSSCLVTRCCPSPQFCQSVPADWLVRVEDGWHHRSVSVLLMTFRPRMSGQSLLLCSLALYILYFLFFYYLY